MNFGPIGVKMVVIERAQCPYITEQDMNHVHNVNLLKAVL